MMADVKTWITTLWNNCDLVCLEVVIILIILVDIVNISGSRFYDQNFMRLNDAKIL